MRRPACGERDVVSGGYVQPEHPQLEYGGSDAHGPMGTRRRKSAVFGRPVGIVVQNARRLKRRRTAVRNVPLRAPMCAAGTFVWCMQGADGTNQTVVNTVLPRLIPLIAQVHNTARASDATGQI